jgi:hypothetical protein
LPAEQGSEALRFLWGETSLDAIGEGRGGTVDGESEEEVEFAVRDTFE